MTSLACLLVSIFVSAQAATLVTPLPSASAPVAPLSSPQKETLKSSSDEKRKLTTEFKRALNDEERTLDHQEKPAMKELSISQNAHLKAWRFKEKKERQAFFEQHESGPERREYVQGYLSRKKGFDQSQKEEVISVKRSWKEKHEHLKETQKQRETEFKAQFTLDPHPKSEVQLKAQ